MARLILGPLLRHVGERTATVWVETDEPGEVSVLHASSPTFTVHGHHYAFVEIDGLEPGSDLPYDVRFNGETVWPAHPVGRFPASRIRTIDPDAPVHVGFGSCRIAPATEGTHGRDALTAYAIRLAGGHAEWPTLLLLIGDQVYADNPPEELRETIRRRRDVTQPPFEEVCDYEEFAELYRLAWSEDAAVRWLLSTVPTFMIFDDHDIRDDWNTSYAWRQEMWSHAWWRRRISSGLGAYWIYQHLGNLPVAERLADRVYAAVRDAPGDAGEIVDEFAEQTDRQPTGSRWSYSHDVGRIRLIMVDSRCGRVLDQDRRAMLDDAESAWLDGKCTGGFDHLLIASSLPYLLPASIHDAESWNEALCAGAWGRWFARFSEKIRQGADLEHWAAFQDSFRSLATSVLQTVRGERGAPPASITFLSGDVHYSYLARVRGHPVAQAVCSPLRNPLAGRFRRANKLACVRAAYLPFRWLARSAGVGAAPMTWRLTDGPWFANAIATVDIDGRTASVRWETPTEEGMADLGRAELTRSSIPAARTCG